MNFKNVLAAVVLIFAAGCAHNVEKADISATANPSEEIQKLENDLLAAQNNHLDVLAPKDFKDSQKSLSKAKQYLEKGKKQEDILEKVAYSRGYLNRAQNTANERRPALEGILKTRDMALTAGARNHPSLRDKLGDIDDDLRDEVDDIAGLSPKKYSDLQNRYLELELESIQATQVGNARAIIEGAKSDRKAKRYAPKTLRQAEVDLKNAENMIVANRSKPEAFKASVEKANESAQLLVDVLNETNRDGKVIDENTALGIVSRNRQISGLERQLTATETEAEKQAKELQTQGQTLEAAKRTVAMQRALDSARKEFSPDEAEVYQQGEKILIRLKAMHFPSGRSDLPASSLALLAKVKDVASILDPQQVLVEGHTDSTGSAAVNQSLSQARAEAVASYLETNGLKGEIQAIGQGFKKPIANNRTSAGRAQNRRVDVIVTPSAEVTKEPEESTVQ